MKVWPLKFREATGQLLFADDSGGWFKSDTAFLERYANDQLTEYDKKFLLSHGHGYEREGDLSHTAFTWRWAARQAVAGPLAYVILVPTLRCNLSCVYCQVSRASEGAKGYDWSSELLSEALSFLDRLEVESIKVEFQGGEPLLRRDLLEQVRDFCRKRFTHSEFVVCTNLQRLEPADWAFLDAEDTFTSTSIDGDVVTHDRQRTMDRDSAEAFFRNARTAVRRLGPDRLSALPTIDPICPPNLNTLIDVYEDLGITSIYMRPVNHHGFARKRPSQGSEIDQWNRIHSDFIDLLIDRNFKNQSHLEEYYFTHCFRRVLMAGQENHVDIRNPNLFGTDYILIDFDGTLYPTDEARMLARVGQIDLSIGHVSSGLDPIKRNSLNATSLNNFDPDCVHCTYQPFCGSDIVDDISRYGRIDIPRHETWFCKRHTAIYDKIFDLIYRADEPVQYSLACWAGVSSWPSTMAMTHR